MEILSSIGHEETNSQYFCLGLLTEAEIGNDMVYFGALWPINVTLCVWLHLLGILPLWLAFVLLHVGSFQMLPQIHRLAHRMGAKRCVLRT